MVASGWQVKQRWLTISHSWQYFILLFVQLLSWQVKSPSMSEYPRAHLEQLWFLKHLSQLATVQSLKLDDGMQVTL